MLGCGDGNRVVALLRFGYGLVCLFIREKQRTSGCFGGVDRLRIAVYSFGYCQDILGGMADKKIVEICQMK